MWSEGVESVRKWEMELERELGALVAVSVLVLVDRTI